VAGTENFMIWGLASIIHRYTYGASLPLNTPSRAILSGIWFGGGGWIKKFGTPSFQGLPSKTFPGGGVLKTKRPKNFEIRPCKKYPGFLISGSKKNDRVGGFLKFFYQIIFSRCTEKICSNTQHSCNAITVFINITIAKNYQGPSTISCMLSIWTCVFKMADHCGNLALATRNSDLKK
jgi:hypothetical protein